MRKATGSIIGFMVVLVFATYFLNINLDKNTFWVMNIASFIGVICGKIGEGIGSNTKNDKEQ